VERQVRRVESGRFEQKEAEVQAGKRQKERWCRRQRRERQR